MGIDGLTDSLITALSPEQTRVLRHVVDERARQEMKWGPQDHSGIEWLLILTEELGEVSREVNELYFGRTLDSSDYREELLHVAAVAVAAVENLDRREAMRTRDRAARSARIEKLQGRVSFVWDATAEVDRVFLDDGVTRWVREDMDLLIQRDLFEEDGLDASTVDAIMLELADRRRARRHG